jgi:hypothetical protein
VKSGFNLPPWLNADAVGGGADLPAFRFLHLGISLSSWCEKFIPVNMIVFEFALRP